MSQFEQGSLVWIPDEDDVACPARVLTTFKVGEAGGKVQTEDGEDRELSQKESTLVREADPEVLDSTVENLIHLNDLNENAILHNLRIRYKEDKIYTNVSSILISVNPFKLLPLYTPEIIDAYREGIRDKPPHVFAIAYAAHTQMIGDSINQSVIVSGESGAGKSEAAKLMLQFLAEVSNRAAKANGRAAVTSNLEQQVLQANPIMEAFGNAKTLRNNNSSRFGKLISVRFDGAGCIVGGSIIEYLLEKSRIVFQAHGERNYHIFYQLLAGAEANFGLKSRLTLDHPETFSYLDQSSVTSIEGVSDEKEFEDMCSAMDTLDFSPEDKESIFSTVAAVLHLGNVRFDVVVNSTSEDGSRVQNTNVSDIVASLLSVDSERLQTVLTSRNIGNRTRILVAYGVDEAANARDAIAKHVYAKMFSRIIKIINNTLHTGAVDNEKVINVLDIFGFESFETNSFEQLCINYCNEKLQFHFNEHIFRLEQAEYASEGVHVPDTDFKDNQPTLDLLEARNTGIFAFIDEEISVPRGSDNTFLNKLKSRWENNHENFVVPRPKETRDAINCFGVKHYAGTVFYNVNGFLEKNKDALHPDILGMLRESTSPFVSGLFPTETADGGGGGGPSGRVRRRGGGKKAIKTLGAAFKTSLASLMETLNATFPHFVRCMKPNGEKIGNKFKSQMMLDQLRYAGLLEVCRIRKLGFPVRREFLEFFKRYRCIETSAHDHQSLAAAMQRSGLLVEGRWAFGHTKIFFKNDQAQRLDVAREQAFIAVALKCQRVIRGFLWRTKYKIWRRTLAFLEEAAAARDLDQLEHWLDMVDELPHKGAHLPLVKSCKMLRTRLVEERRIEMMLREAAETRDLRQLQSAVAAADAMDPPLASAIVMETRAVLERLLEEEAVKTQLVAAMSRRDRAALEELLSRADEMEMDECDEILQAMALKQRIEEEEETVDALRSAIAARDLTALSAYLSKTMEMGLNVPEVEAGRALQGVLQEEAAVRSAISTAAATSELPALEQALQKAADLGLTSENCAEVAQGSSALTNLRMCAEVNAELESAVASRSRSAIEAAIAKADKMEMEGMELAAARRLRQALIAEEECNEALRRAAASENVTDLSTALAEAARLGLQSAEVDLARSKASKLGAQNALRTKLAELSATAAGSQDPEATLAELDAALAEAAQKNQAQMPEAVTATAVAERLREDLQIMESAQRDPSIVELGKLLSKMTERGMSTAPAFSQQYTSLRAAHEGRSQRAGALNALVVAARAKDPAGLQTAIDAAVEAGITDADAELQEAKKAYNIAVNHKRINAALVDAVAAGDKPRMQSLLDEAKSLGIEGDGVQQARVIVEREAMVAETMAALEASKVHRDLQQLNAALAQAIELGLTGAAVSDAQRLRDELTVHDNACAGVRAAMRTMELKAQNPNGIVRNDIAPLETACEAAKEQGVPDNMPEMNAAKILVETMHRQLHIQASLSAALLSGDRLELKEALDMAEDMELSLALMDSVKAELKELDAEYRLAQQGDDMDTLPLDEAEAERLKQERIARQQRAANPKFNFRNFSALRSPDDFARGVVLNKKKVKEGMLKWQNTLVSKSLLELDPPMQKLALQVHKALLGYMGDKQMSFPATLAQDILQKGLENIPLRNEIYCQVMKQLSSNPKPESIAKGWQMMCMCVSTFPPTIDFENYLLNFILKKVESRGAVKNYAKYCLRALEGMLTSGASGFVPSVEEIQAYKERPPILATVELVDGMVLTEDLPVTPDLNVQKVLEICTHFLDLSDPRADTMGIFVYDVEADPGQELDDPFANMPYADLPRTPRPLRNEDYLGDVLVQKARQRRNFKFVYKRKIALPQQNGPSVDPMYNRLIYLQAEDDLITTGNLLIVDSDELVSELAALSIAVAMPDEGFPRSVEELTNIDVVEFVPPNWREVRAPHEWAQAVLEGAARVGASTPKADLDDLQLKLIQIAQEHPYYGAHWFYCHRVNDQPDIVAAMPRDLIIGFNADGMHILDAGEGRAALATFGYADIYRWGGSSSQFSLIVWDAAVESTFELILTTAQAADMAACILDTINAIMSLSGV